MTPALFMVLFVFPYTAASEKDAQTCDAQAGGCPGLAAPGQILLQKTVLPMHTSENLQGRRRKGGKGRKGQGDDQNATNDDSHDDQGDDQGKADQGAECVQASDCKSGFCRLVTDRTSFETYSVCYAAPGQILLEKTEGRRRSSKGDAACVDVTFDAGYGPCSTYGPGKGPAFPNSAYCAGDVMQPQGVSAAQSCPQCASCEALPTGPTAAPTTAPGWLGEGEACKQASHCKSGMCGPGSPGSSYEMHSVCYVK